LGGSVGMPKRGRGRARPLAVYVKFASIPPTVRVRRVFVFWGE